MREKKSLAILLKKILLPNDDAVLEFLTMEMGKITVFAKKFAKSKKRNEIDFFRVIEIGIFQGRNSKSLKAADTFSVFHNFSRDFASSQVGFAWLEILRNILPEEEINQDLFKKIIDIFSYYEADDREKWDAFFQITILNFAGFWPKFDAIRGDIFFDPSLKTISRAVSLEVKSREIPERSGENFPEAVFVSNPERQTLEFLRRSDLSTFLAKKEKLPTNLKKVFEIIFCIESFK